MTTERREVRLDGCRPTPLAHYLKALGVLRLVAEQTDPQARGAWVGEHFVLRSNLSHDELTQFFLENYAPTPLVGPWNGGSGFHPKDNKTAIDAITAGDASRLRSYRQTIEAARQALRRTGLDEKPSGDDKLRLLEACRATLPDEALNWLDAAYVLTTEATASGGTVAKFPPLLGTGGNDGRLDFTNNFMQRLLDLFDAEQGRPTGDSAPLLRAALFDEPTDALQKGAAIGQFLPSDAGGANALSGFDADSLINPWDFVLMLEGAVIFAAAAVKKMEQETSGALSYPFTVRQAGVGYASAAGEDEAAARAEIWLPVWKGWVSRAELQSIFAEGRAQVGGRPARNGVDFARAVADLGVDRGIQAFYRYGFQQRNGLSYFAVPLNRFAVRAQPQVRLLAEVDHWLDSFRRRASGTNAPGSAQRALRRLEGSIIDLCQHGDALRTQQVLVALGQCEQVMATSRRWTEDSFLRPVPSLSPRWLERSYDGSTEFRLAAALASLRGRTVAGKPTTPPLRHQLEPIKSWIRDNRLYTAWDFEAGRDVVWSNAVLPDVMNDILQRRLIRAAQSGAAGYPDSGRVRAQLPDVAAFIEGQTDDARLASLLWGLSLVDWFAFQREDFALEYSGREPLPGAFYALIKLCFAGQPVRHGDSPAEGVEIPLQPRIHRLASSGRGSEASLQSIRRLRGSGLVPALSSVQAQGRRAVRAAAALLFPIGRHDLTFLAKLLLRPETTIESDQQPGHSEEAQL